VTAKAANALGEVAVSGGRGEAGTVVVRRRIALAAGQSPATDAGKARELLVAWSSPASRVLLLRPPAGKS
jgi:hypothetical protein